MTESTLLSKREATREFKEEIPDSFTETLRMTESTLLSKREVTRSFKEYVSDSTPETRRTTDAIAECAGSTR
jgi:hypothetical protein